MLSGFAICVLALTSSTSAIDLLKATEKVVQEPGTAPVQVPVPVVDLMNAQSQVGLGQQNVDLMNAQPPVAPGQQNPVPQMTVATDAIQTLQGSEPYLAPQPVQSPMSIIQGASQPPSAPAAAAAQVALPGVASQPPVPALAVPALAVPRVARNVTRLAFGQITDLGSEFHQLRSDDEAHIKQLGTDVHLRDHLEKELHEAEERLEHDNGELAQETTGIVQPVPATQNSEVASAQNTTEDSSAALVQSQSVSSKAASDQIAVATERDVKMLTDDMNALHSRDVQEVKALRGNAETRTSLTAQIAKEREELLADSGGLAANLGQIRDLVAPTAMVGGNAAVAATPSDEAQLQQEASSSQAPPQETAPASQETLAAAGVGTVTPEQGAAGTASNSWLR